MVKGFLFLFGGISLVIAEGTDLVCEGEDHLPSILRTPTATSARNTKAA
jgi:hypothetical protein